MDVELTKLELIEMLLSTKKETVLDKIRAILEEEHAVLTDEQYKIIDGRRARHENGESQSYSWEETKQRAKRDKK